VGEGLRRYLVRVKKSVKADLYAICPINIRRDKLTNESLAGNDISLMTANLRTTEPDLRERLRKLTGGTRASKNVQKASSVKELVAMSKQAPNLLLALASRIAVQAALRASSTRPLSNAIITNVPGPQEPLYFMGAKLVLFSGGTPISPVTGLTIPITSYDGRLIISFTGAASWVQDPQGLAECLDESFEAMKLALGPPAGARRKAIAKAKAKAKAKTGTRARTKTASRRSTGRRGHRAAR
jgi:diacylglycerol O-acyltransferase / wax synthase